MVAAVAVGVAAPSALADTLCVGAGAQCFPQLQDAVDAAGDGDRIAVRPGTYDGGVTINVSVDVVGAGADRTVLRGGGPVITIGTFGAAAEPTVTIRGLKITGGVTRSSPESVPFTGEEGVFAAGGGISMPPNEDFSGGADVTIHDSVITGNRVAPSASILGGPPCPNGDPCPFAFAGGGGIDSWGTLKLVDSRVTDNAVGSASGLSTLASDADGGGISARLGNLTLTRTTVRDNEATATGPNGRFAEAGAIWADTPKTVIRHSSITGNRAALASALPNSVDQLAIGGAIQFAGGFPDSVVRIIGSVIADNAVEATNSVGNAVASSGAVNTAQIDIDFFMRDVVLARNRAVAATVGDSSGSADADSGAGALLGTVRDTQLVGNEVTARSVAGDATAASGATFIRGRLIDSAAIDNSARATSPHGTAAADGGALLVDAELLLRRTTIRGNTVEARGRHGVAQGGGIFDGTLFTNGGPLTLVDSAVLHNVATGSPRVALRGGGIYIPTRRLTLIRSSVGDNIPDQVCGC